MNNKRIRLAEMRRQNKITNLELNILLSQLGYRTWLDTIILWILMPYANISAKVALTIGGFGFVIICSTGYFGRYYFPGIPGVAEIVNPALHLTLIKIFLNQIIQWLLLSIIFYLSAIAWHVRNLRLIDFLALIAIAYIARVLFSLELFVINLIAPDFVRHSNDLSKLAQYYPKILVSIWGINQYLMEFWLYRLYFVSLELASGLTKLRLWIVYILGLILAQSINFNFSRYLLHWIN